MKSEDFIVYAKDLVKNYAKEHLCATDIVDDVTIDSYIVTFGYVLGNMKAMVSTTLLDGMYYEVTYNAGKNEIYLDAYKKFENRSYQVSDLVSSPQQVQTDIFDFLGDIKCQS